MNVYLGHLGNYIQGPMVFTTVRSILNDARATGNHTLLYQQHTASSAEFSAELWLVLGYEPEPSPGEEVGGST